MQGSVRLCVVLDCCDAQLPAGQVHPLCFIHSAAASCCQVTHALRRCCAASWGTRRKPHAGCGGGGVPGAGGWPCAVGTPGTTRVRPAAVTSSFACLGEGGQGGSCCHDHRLQSRGAAVWLRRRQRQRQRQRQRGTEGATNQAMLGDSCTWRAQRESRLPALCAPGLPRGSSNASLTG